MIFDVCVIGHITRDIIGADDGEFEMPGGTAYYTAIALKNLGMSVAVITKLNDSDVCLLRELEKDSIPVFLGKSDSTTTFRNVYSSDTSTREQLVKDVATPFAVGDVSHCEARIFHLGPLMKNDIPLEVIRCLADRARISLDAQGFVRNFAGMRREWARVDHVEWEEQSEALPFVNILKANEEEARILSHEQNMAEIALDLSSHGPEEVVITRGANPSLIYSKGKSYWVPSFPPRNKALVDPTGCGDTYMAAYLYYREKTTQFEEVGKFAAMTASLKLECSSPFRGDVEDIRSFAVAVGQPLSPIA